MIKIRRRCKCGCGERVDNYRNEWIKGHQHTIRKGKNSPNYKHGLRNHKLYMVWIGMKQRCHNPKNKYYQYYGGRGIIVYARWKLSFKPFYSWSISHDWKDGLEIDRIDNDGNYHPDNCRFVTNKVNANNRRQANNTSGYKYVSFVKPRNKYRSSPTINGKRIFLGYFDTAEEAADAIQQYIDSHTCI